MIREKDYLGTNQEILGGLRSAIERGEDLKSAMMTFYRAGYSKEEIEEAARVYLEMEKNSEDISLKKTQEKTQEKKEVKKEDKGDVKKGKEKKFSTLGEKNNIQAKPADEIKKKPETVQKVSKYEPTKKPKKTFAGKAITVILIAVLLILIGLLAAVVLFKDELVVFFNNLFG